MTDEGRRTTGFSHGTAGIVYALLRLYEHTRDARLLETAKEAIAYEDTQYSPENRNWVDFSKPDEPGYKWQWCYGAPGIGLARLGGLAVLDTEQVDKDIELSLQSTLEFGVQGVDHPCCGNMGRAEVLLASGRRLSRPELEEAARERAWRVVTRAERTDGFVAPDAAQAGGQPGLLPGHGRHRLRAAAHGPSRSAPFGALVGVNGDGRSRPQPFLSLARTAEWLQRRHGQPHTSRASSSLVRTVSLKLPQPVPLQETR